MPVTGALSHLDLSVGYSTRSIDFYEKFLTALGHKRWQIDLPDFTGDDPKRAAWMLKLADGSWFGIEVRPASDEVKNVRYNRYAPGPHHLAFHAESREKVDEVFEKMTHANAEILDPPSDYPDYAPEYYAVFFADPDGVKLEVVYEPQSNP